MKFLSKNITFMVRYSQDSYYKLFCSLMTGSLTLLVVFGLFYFMKEIPLSKGAKTCQKKHLEQLYAMVDDEDYDRLSKYSWSVIRRKHTNYATTRRGSKRVYLHREIMSVTDSNMLVDHKDRNGLNNQRSNLRVCTHKENCRNRISNKGSSSTFKGVGWHIRNKKWEAYIHGKYIAAFDNEEDAARAYDAKAKELHGEFANLNFKEVISV